MNLIRFQLNLSYIYLKGFLKMYLRALCYCTDFSSGVPNRAALLGSVSWHKVMENRKPVHPSSPHCRSLLQMCIGHTPLNLLLCVFVWQGCCRGSPPSRSSLTRWCQSSTRTLRPSSWTLKAERCLVAPWKRTQTFRRQREHWRCTDGQEEWDMAVGRLYSACIWTFYTLQVSLKVTLTYLTYSNYIVR